MTVSTETLASLSNSLLYSAMAVYAVAMCGYAAALAFAGSPVRGAAVPESEPARVLAYADTGGAGPDRAEADAAGPPRHPQTALRDGNDRAGRVARAAVSLTVLAFALHLLAVVARAAAAERAPWGNMYEFSITGALAVTGVYLVLLVRRDVRWLGLFVVLPVLLTLGLAVSVLYTETAELVPALQSVWLVIHVAAAILAAGILTVGFAQTVCYLVQQRRESRLSSRATATSGSFMDRLPSAAALDRAAFRMHAFAFPIWTFAVVAGAIWAEQAWGRYWGWDPKETWAFITWMVYAVYLHARATAGWRGRKAAYVAVLGYATFLFNYLVVNIWLVGFHSYAGVG